MIDERSIKRSLLFARLNHMTSLFRLMWYSKWKWYNQNSEIVCWIWRC